jgi:DnaJ-class molecular chaperone
MSDNQVTYEGVTYYVSENLPPLKSHVVTCPRCDGVGQMYGRDCRVCKGRGLLFPAISDERAETAGG